METSPPGSLRWIESPSEMQRGLWFTCGFLEMRCIGNNARVSLLVVLADLSRQCLLVGCGGNYVRRHVCVRIASSREKNGFNCVWFAHQAETAWGAQAEGPWFTPTGPRPEGPRFRTFQVCPKDLLQVCGRLGLR